MKVFLMFKDRDFDLHQKLPPNGEALIQDLELNTLFNTMALGDNFLFNVAKVAILSSLTDIETILYRQDILKDCLKNPSTVKDMYDIAVESIESVKKTFFGFFNKYIVGMLDSSIQAMKLLVDTLKKLRKIADDRSDDFNSEGFKRFFGMIEEELSDEYFKIIERHLNTLEFRDGVLISAELGRGNKGKNYVLRKPNHEKKSWIGRILPQKTHGYSFRIADRDENGAKALSELKERGLNSVANALTQSVNHILDFFNILRTELAFYIGALNLHDQLVKIEEPICFPLPVSHLKRERVFKELYDPCLALTLKRKIVGNDLELNNKNLFIITGANQGGKSTFLRSVGLSQLMMQCGMFAPAKSFSANVCKGLFTHYKREEDITMKSGKFDEELKRMNDIVENLTANSTVLFNESFSATNEIEGSEIARQIVSALLEKHIEVFFVTHMYEFAHGFYEKQLRDAAFLTAERKENGDRTFKIIEGKPLSTSYGKDLYDNIFKNKATVDKEKDEYSKTKI